MATLNPRTTTIDIGYDFSAVPSGRYRSKGDFTGEVFREDLLLPALRANDKVRVVLDNTEGFGSSFLDEAFAGIILTGAMSKDELMSRLELVGVTAAGKRYRDKVIEYITNAGRDRT